MASKQRVDSITKLAVFAWLILAVISLCLVLSSVTCAPSDRQKPSKAKHSWFQKLSLCGEAKEGDSVTDDDLSRQYEKLKSEPEHVPKIDFQKPTPHPDEIDESSMSSEVKRYRQFCRDEYALAKIYTNMEDRSSPEAEQVLIKQYDITEKRMNLGRELGILSCPDDIVNNHGPVTRPPLRDVNDHLIFTTPLEEKDIFDQYNIPRPTPHPEEIGEACIPKREKRFRQLCREEYALSTMMQMFSNRMSGYGLSIEEGHAKKAMERIDLGRELGINWCPDDIVNNHGPVTRPPMQKAPW